MGKPAVGFTDQLYFSDRRRNRSLLDRSAETARARLFADRASLFCLNFFDRERVHLVAASRAHSVRFVGVAALANRKFFLAGLGFCTASLGLRFIRAKLTR